MINRFQHCSQGCNPSLTVHTSRAPPQKYVCRSQKAQPSISHPQDEGPVWRSQLLRVSIAGGLVAGAQGKLYDTSKAQADALPVPVPQGGFSKVQLKVWEDCELAVSIYPHFSYNAQGAGGLGTAEDLGEGMAKVSFDPKKFIIPPLDYRSTKVLGVPIPPPLKIAIDMQKLEGLVHLPTGEANLDFVSNFYFTIGDLYAAAPLVVKANLSTSDEESGLFTAQGEKLSNGRGRLVGIADVPETGDAFLDKFLMLPTNCLAVLSAELLFS